eukprot:1307417-Pyramimonas_sp.AAC.1
MAEIILGNNFAMTETVMALPASSPAAVRDNMTNDAGRAQEVHGLRVHVGLGVATSRLRDRRGTSGHEVRAATIRSINDAASS